MTFLEKLTTGMILMVLLLSPVTRGATLTVSKTGGNASSSLLYGLMFEVGDESFII